MTYPKLLPAVRTTLLWLGLVALIHGGITADAAAEANPAQVKSVQARSTQANSAEPNPARGSRLTISFKTSDTDGRPLGPTVMPGDRIRVDILIALDASNVPLPDVRLLQFDFRGISDSLAIESFRWLLDAKAYGFQRIELPMPSTASLLMGSDDRLLRLTNTPASVAQLELTVNGSATLDVGVHDEGRARVRCGFKAKSIFAPSEGNIAGGRLELSVAQEPPSDLTIAKPVKRTDQETGVQANDPSGDHEGADHAKAKRTPKRCGNGTAAALLFMTLVCAGLKLRFSSSARH